MKQTEKLITRAITVIMIVICVVSFEISPGLCGDGSYSDPAVPSLMPTKNLEQAGPNDIRSNAMQNGQMNTENSALSPADNIVLTPFHTEAKIPGFGGGSAGINLTPVVDGVPAYVVQFDEAGKFWLTAGNEKIEAAISSLTETKIVMTATSSIASIYTSFFTITLDKINSNEFEITSIIENTSVYSGGTLFMQTLAAWNFENGLAVSSEATSTYSSQSTVSKSETKRIYQSSILNGELKFFVVSNQQNDFGRNDEPRDIVKEINMFDSLGNQTGKIVVRRDYKTIIPSSLNQASISVIDLIDIEKLTKTNVVKIYNMDNAVQAATFEMADLFSISDTKIIAAEIDALLTEKTVTYYASAQAMAADQGSETKTFVRNQYGDWVPDGTITTKKIITGSASRSRSEHVEIYPDGNAKIIFIQDAARPDIRTETAGVYDASKNVVTVIHSGLSNSKTFYQLDTANRIISVEIQTGLLDVSRDVDGTLLSSNKIFWSYNSNGTMQEELRLRYHKDSFGQSFFGAYLTFDPITPEALRSEVSGYYVQAPAALFDQIGSVKDGYLIDQIANAKQKVLYGSGMVLNIVDLGSSFDMTAARQALLQPSAVTQLPASNLTGVTVPGFETKAGDAVSTVSTQLNSILPATDLPVGGSSILGGNDSPSVFETSAPEKFSAPSFESIGLTSNPSPLLTTPISGSTITMLGDAGAKSSDLDNVTEQAQETFIEVASDTKSQVQNASGKTEADSTEVLEAVATTTMTEASSQGQPATLDAADHFSQPQTAFPINVVLPAEVKTEILLPVTKLEIRSEDKNALAQDLERLTDLLIQMPNTTNLKSIEFKNYLQYLQETIERLVKLAEKYKDDKEVQNAIQNALINIFESLLKTSQTKRATLSKVESDLALFEELIKQETENSTLTTEETKVLDQNIDRTLEILRRGAMEKKTTALRRAIYRSWYRMLAQKARKMRFQRMRNFKQLNEKNLPLAVQAKSASKND